LAAADEDAEVDLVELGAAEARAMGHDRSPAMTVVGSFDALSGPDSLGRFLVAGQVLDTNLFSGGRSPSEQTALGLYRVLRLRGAPFWDGAARHVAEAVRCRMLTAPVSGPVHDVWGERETHTRFLTDGWRLLLAESERSPEDGRWTEAADLASEMVERLAVPFGGGRWYVHDSLELASGRNDLVLNTHAQVMAARLAANLPIELSAQALATALDRRPPTVRGVAIATAIGMSDATVRAVPGRWSAGSQELRTRTHRAAARQRHRHGYLKGPFGHIARDACDAVPPPYYLTVNLYDLGVLVANTTMPAPRRAFEAGVRYARASGYFGAEIDSGHALATLIPIVLGQAGLVRAAERAAARAERAGVRPAPGWPGHEDQPWRRMRAGTV